MSQPSRGRPSKFTPTVTAALIAALTAGHHYKPACKQAGISYDLFRDWVLCGEEAERAGDFDNPFYHFLQQVHTAEMQAQSRALEAWQGHFDKDYKAARDFLARRDPDHWADQSRVRVQHEGGPSLNVQVLAITDLSSLAGLLAIPSPEPPQLIEGEIVNESPTDRS